MNQVTAALRDVNSRWLAWNAAVPFDRAVENEPGHDAYEFLKFTNSVDALLTAACIWPVGVVDRGRDSQGDWVALQATPDLARDRMAMALSLEPPSRQMERTFFEDAAELDQATRFHLVEQPKVDKAAAEEAVWAFTEAQLVGGGRRYVFRRTGGQANIPTGAAFLRRTDIGGSAALLERRLKAIEGLREQATMLRAIEAPGSASRDTMEQLVEDDAIIRLDDRKRQALREIWRSQPLYALQGPPGTGKTALVEAMVRRALDLDPSLQLVATAQANDTVKALAAKLERATSHARAAPEPPLLVRLDDDSSSIDPARLAGDMAAELSKSPLALQAPAHIARRIAALAAGTGQEGRRERSYMARLVTRAANVVLATSTSGGLSRLLEGGKRFDWCIVEEAGKAHGFDLALPMQASHRMLMIGDHEQLPAFNEDAYLNLLEHPERVRTAFLNGAAFVHRKLGFDLGPMESDEHMAAFEARCARWRPMVRMFGHVFQESRALPDGRAAIASRLVEQYRMHPEICDLVRACFYPDLRTADSARERLNGPDPFEVVSGGWLPPERIVFVDTPYVQAAPGAQGQDIDRTGRPLLSSQVEAEMVVRVLSQIVPRGRCDVQVLTPYNRQAGLLRKTIRRASATGSLCLTDFGLPADEELGSTIDSFQGEEADIVIVSLVRNNHAAPRGGVGILAERPRLNVMLSRARRKLVLVGSWDFFMKRATADALSNPADPMHHLARVFHELGEAVRHGTASICRPVQMEPLA